MSEPNDRELELAWKIVNDTAQVDSRNQEHAVIAGTLASRRSELQEQHKRELAAAVERARADERAAAVRFLRDFAADMYSAGFAYFVQTLASAIERGEHLK